MESVGGGGRVLSLARRVSWHVPVAVSAGVIHGVLAHALLLRVGGDRISTFKVVHGPPPPSGLLRGSVGMGHRTLLRGGVFSDHVAGNSDWQRRRAGLSCPA